MQFHIITMSTYGVGLSGGDRIWIELSKKISQKYPIKVYLWEEGKTIAKREGLKTVEYVLWSAQNTSRLGFFINYFARIGIAIWRALFLKLDNSPETIIYSASEFWQDTIPTLILKFRYPKVHWIAAWYMSAPNPFVGFREKGKANFMPDIKTLAYWLVQLPIKPLIRKFADTIFITSEPDKKQFPSQSKSGKVVVIKGGVDIARTNSFLKRYKKTPKKYDAIFQGRFHPQKGLIELIDIWKMLVNDLPNAKLGLIGDGPLMEEVVQKINKLNLSESIKLFGYLFDGPKKYKLFAQSKIVVHPAIYDSGGMAAAEAMAFGLPGVSFDLKALKTYYPKGMVKVPLGDKKKFYLVIKKLLSDPRYYKTTKTDAYQLVQDYWDWGALSNRVIIKLKS